MDIGSKADEMGNFGKPGDTYAVFGRLSNLVNFLQVPIKSNNSDLGNANVNRSKCTVHANKKYNIYFTFTDIKDFYFSFLVKFISCTLFLHLPPPTSPLFSAVL